MPQHVIASYNIEHMNRLFSNNQVKANEVQRATKIARVIQDVNPLLLGICEAANSDLEHQDFIANFLPGSGYQVVSGVSRGAQNLVFYYRDPLQVVSVDENIGFYDPFEIDIDQDGVIEKIKWERKPLEVVFQFGNNGPQFRAILVHTKSKGIFNVVDLASFEVLSLGNRKKLIAQAIRLRERLNDLMANNPIPTFTMGDMNDGPGQDVFEKSLGKSFVETVTGDVNNPAFIFHNTLWYMGLNNKTKDDLWTADFPDPIVSNPMGFNHRVWIDHVLVSPDTLLNNNSIRYVMHSGAIGNRQLGRNASDHYIVSCSIEV